MFVSCSMQHHSRRFSTHHLITFAVLAVLVLLYPFRVGHADDSSPKRVLVMHGLWEMGEWEASFDEHFRELIRERSDGQVELRFDYIGVDHSSDLAHYDTTVENLARELDQNPVDLLVGVLPSTTHFVEHLEARIGKTPALYVLPDDFQTSELLLRQNHAVVQSTAVHALRKTLKNIDTLHPQLRKLVVVAGRSENDRVYLTRARQVLENFKSSSPLEIDYLVGAPLADMERQVKGLPRDSALLFITFEQDSSGHFYLHEDVAERLSVAASVPMYASMESLLGHGVVGGNVSSPRDYAQIAADFSFEILDNPHSYQLHSADSATLEIYDWRQLQRWNISEASLPEGSLVEYRPETVWYEYRGTAITTISILLLQAGLIAALIVLVRRDRIARRRLDKSEQYYRSVVTSMSDGVTIQDRDGNIIEHNRAAEKILRLNSAEIMARSSFDPRWQAIRIDGSPYPGEEHPAMVALRSGQPVEGEVMGLRRAPDDTTWIEISSQPINLWKNTEAAVVTTFKDITEQRVRQVAAEFHQKRLDNLFRLAQMEEASDNEIKDFALEASLGITDSSIGYIYLVDDDQQTLRLYSWSQGVMESCTVIDPETVYRLEETGLWGEALRQMTPIITNDYTAESPWKKGIPEGHVPMTRHLNLPLLVEGKAVLVVGVANKSEDYDDADVQSLELLMDQMWRLLEQRRLRRETALAKQRFETFLDAMPAIAFTIDGQGSFLFRNRCFLEQFGEYDERQMVRGEGHLFDTGEAGRFRSDYAKLAAGETVKREVSVNTDSGKRVFNLHRFPMHDAFDDSLQIGGIAEEVTERKAIEATLLFVSREGWQDTEDDFFVQLVRFLGELLGITYCFVDRLIPDRQRAVTLGLYADGKVVDNLEYDLHGTPCENVAESQSCFYPRNIQQQFPEDTMLVDMQAEGYAGIPLRSSQGGVIGILGVMDTAPLQHRELTLTLLRQVAGRASAEIERLEALEVLKESEKRFRHLSEEFQTLLDAVPDVILLLNAERQVEWANAAATRSMGLHDVLNDKPCYELEPCRDSYCIDCVTLSVIKSGRMQEKSMRTDDGHLWEVRAFPILDRDGSVRNVLEMRSDVSEKQRLRDEALRSHQLASLGELSAGIAHEVNNPIGLVAWQLPLFKAFFEHVLPLMDEHVAAHGDFLVGDLQYSQLRDELPQLVDDMQVGIERVRTILSELKTFAMPVDQQQSQRIDLNDVLRRATSLIGKTLTKGRHRIEIDYYPEPLWVEAHLQRLEQVVVNLLMNAQQSLPEEGGEIAVFFQPGLGGNHCLRIRDNGCGMDDETMRHITDPFYTTRRESGGSGLGLSISLRIIKDYGGNIYFNSSPGVGTTIDVCLPVAPEGQ